LAAALQSSSIIAKMMILKSPCSNCILWLFGEFRGWIAGWMKEAPMVDRLSRKTTGRHRAAGMTQRYNHSENLAADSLQIQPAEVIGSIYDCGRGGFGLPSAKSRTTSDATRPL
jgi:hypothetical protein